MMLGSFIGFNFCFMLFYTKKCSVLQIFALDDHILIPETAGYQDLSTDETYHNTCYKWILSQSTL